MELSRMVTWCIWAGKKWLPSLGTPLRAIFVWLNKGIPSS